MDGAHEAAVRAHAADADATPSEHKFSYPDGTPPPRLDAADGKISHGGRQGHRLQIGYSSPSSLFVISLCVENLFCYFTDR